MRKNKNPDYEAGIFYFDLRVDAPKPDVLQVEHPDSRWEELRLYALQFLKAHAIVFFYIIIINACLVLLNTNNAFSCFEHFLNRQNNADAIEKAAD